MRRVIPASFWCAVLATVSWAVSGQGRSDGDPGNPFWDRSDNGEIVHVLPSHASIHSPHDTQPTDAPARRGTMVYPASYGSGNLLNHGGPQMANASFQAIYWNVQASNSTQTSLGYGTIKAQINAFASNFSNGHNWDNSSTADYTIVQEYGSTMSGSMIAPTLDNLGFYLDDQPTKALLSDSKVRSYLTSLFNGRLVSPSASTLYGVYFPPGMKISLQGGTSCSSFCGYHGHFTYNGVDIKYASFPYLDCTGCSLAGKSVADMLTIVTSHEIREAVTDPDLNSWYDSAGYEADDKCAWHNLYQMTTGGFWVQPEYSNGGTQSRSGFTAMYPGPGCVVPNR